MCRSVSFNTKVEGIPPVPSLEQLAHEPLHLSSRHSQGRRACVSLLIRQTHWKAWVRQHASKESLRTHCLAVQDLSPKFSLSFRVQEALQPMTGFIDYSSALNICLHNDLHYRSMCLASSIQTGIGDVWTHNRVWGPHRRPENEFKILSFKQHEILHHIRASRTKKCFEAA